MYYLKKFELLNDDDELRIAMNKKNIHNSLYPLRIFTEKEMKEINFDQITIFYGGNGSGKTTLLNIISDKIEANKKNFNDQGEIYNEYMNMCDFEICKKSEIDYIKYIASDDIFDYLLDIRAINNRVNRRKDDLSKEYLNAKYNNHNSANLEYNDLVNFIDSRKMTQSKYIRSRLTNNNIIQQSNGESALEFWENEIKENAIYLLDEPENSLSAENQIKLKKFIEESARFYNCQFIISTHSPFLLGLNEALIYDLDEIPVKTKKWTELDNVKVYYNFFKDNEYLFKE